MPEKRRADEHAAPVDLKALHAKIGELTQENNFLEGALTKAGIAERKPTIGPAHDLPIEKQAEVLQIGRSSVSLCSTEAFSTIARYCTAR
jgi:hypothetical protein